LYLRRPTLDLIEIGNFEDDMARIAECDWVIEVVKEDLEDQEEGLREGGEAPVKPGSIRQLEHQRHSDSVDGRRAWSEDMSKPLPGHAFLQSAALPASLLEIIPGPDTLPDVIGTHGVLLRSTCSGKGVVYAKDTPNFVANRHADLRQPVPPARVSQSTASAWKTWTR
jgi:3-hydroxyacyl-CoA dehydrogenase